MLAYQFNSTLLREFDAGEYLAVCHATVALKYRMVAPQNYGVCSLENCSPADTIDGDGDYLPGAEWLAELHYLHIRYLWLMPRCRGLVGL